MYDPKYKIPKWVKYELMSTETDGPYSRKGLNFCQDPSANLPQADDYDYKNSGWSKGHMAPAADFKWSRQAMIETFYYTNCCPQNQSLNSGQWNTLEKKVREWANRYGSVTVVTGPLVWNNEYGAIGNNKVVGAASGNTKESNIRKVQMNDRLIETARNIRICLGD